METKQTSLYKAAILREQSPSKTKIKSFTHLLHQPQSFSQAGEQGYLLGLRGFFTLSSFIWVFLSTFAPVTVKDAQDREGLLWQKVIRDTFSVIFWNEPLIYSAFILISSRVIGIPFFRNSTKTVIASAIFRRGLRLWFPVAVSLAVVKILSSTIGTAYIDAFKESTGNSSFDTPYTIPSALAYFNSVFNIFWTTSKFSEQAGNTAFPSQTLWIVNVIYTQSYTVYMTMVIIPYTRNAWRLYTYTFFIITAWWLQSWAWFTITGLFLADLCMNMQFKERAQQGIKVWANIRFPVWIPACALILAGLIMQYTWTDWRPQYENQELIAHTGLYYTGGLNTLPKASEPQARDDCYLVLLGFLLILETTNWMQRLFQSPVLLYLGRRSLSWFLTQSIIIYTAGIKLHQKFTVEHNVPSSAATAIVFIVIVPTLILVGEFFYRLVDWPSQVFTHIIFIWIQE